MAEDEYEYEYEEEEEELVDLDSITDEKTLIEMLDQAEDFDERKKIRDRLKKIQYERRSEMAQLLKHREEAKDQAIKQRFQEAEEKKKRTLAMYNDMAKSPGDRKTMDVNIYKYNEASSGRDSPAQGERKKDLVEEAIRDRYRSAEERKKRILAAYDYAAKTQPAGREKFVDFTAFRHADVSDFTPPTPVGSCTFGMSGGVPKVVKGTGSTPGTPVITPKPGKDGPNFPKPEEEYLDPMEKAIRARLREAEERKLRTLAAYDMVAKSGGAGPKVVVLEEFRDLKVDSEEPWLCITVWMTLYGGEQLEGSWAVTSRGGEMAAGLQKSCVHEVEAIYRNRNHHWTTRTRPQKMYNECGRPISESNHQASGGMTANQLAQELSAATGRTVLGNTVHWRLHKRGLYTSVTKYEARH